MRPSPQTDFTYPKSAALKMKMGGQSTPMIKGLKKSSKLTKPANAMIKAPKSDTTGYNSQSYTYGKAMKSAHESNYGKVPSKPQTDFMYPPYKKSDYNQ